MLKKLLFLTALISAPLAAKAADMTPLAAMPSGIYKIDPSHASVTWKVSHLGLSNYTARFTKIDATLTFNAENPERSRVIAKIDPSSIRTDYPNAAEKDFDRELAAGEEWFNAAKFPSIEFVSNKIEITGPNTGKIYGNLTLLGVSKPVVLDTVFNGAYAEKPFSSPIAAALGFSASTRIKRSDWGFNTYIPTIGDEVAIAIEAEFEQVNIKTN